MGRSCLVIKVGLEQIMTDYQVMVIVIGHRMEVNLDRVLVRISFIYRSFLFGRRFFSRLWFLAFNRRISFWMSSWQSIDLSKWFHGTCLFLLLSTRSWFTWEMACWLQSRWLYAPTFCQWNRKSQSCYDSTESNHAVCSTSFGEVQSCLLHHVWHQWSPCEYPSRSKVSSIE